MLCDNDNCHLIVITTEQPTAVSRPRFPYLNNCGNQRCNQFMLEPTIVATGEHRTKIPALGRAGKK